MFNKLTSVFMRLYGYRHNIVKLWIHVAVRAPTQFGVVESGHLLAVQRFLSQGNVSFDAQTFYRKNDTVLAHSLSYFQ